MESPSESTAVMTHNESSPGLDASSTTLSPGGGEDLSRDEGNNTMGKNRMKVVSTDVAAILQTPHVTSSSMWNLVDKILCRLAAMLRDSFESIGLICSAAVRMRELILDAQALTNWHGQHKGDGFEAQQDMAVVDPEVQTIVMIYEEFQGFEYLSQSLADQISKIFPGPLPGEISDKVPCFSAYIEELRRDVSNTVGTRNVASIDVAEILQASDVSPSLMRSIYDKLSSQALAMRHDSAESKLRSDSALESLEAIVVDLLYIMAWYEEQNEDDFEVQQVSFDPNDDASSQIRSFFTKLCSTTLVLQSDVTRFKRHTDDQKDIEEFLVKFQTSVRQVENDFSFKAQQDAVDLDD